MALLDVQVAMLANLSAAYLCSGAVPGRMGNAHQAIVPYHVFHASDDFVIVAVGNDGQFARFCEVMGEPGWSRDERFATNPARVGHRDLLVGLISERMSAKPASAWLEALEAADVPCGPINDLGQVFEDPQVRHRRMEVEAPHPVAGRVRMVANPMKLSGTPIAHDRPPPLLGEHTDAVLRRVLSLDEARLAALREAGVL
jgi:crotonobetainyl-CoA:carnitine CoA-transferase CaiB-like acyl-CoA transferase